MASGINSTFRQVGIATGIALLGTLFTSRVTSAVLAQTARDKGLARMGHTLANAVQSGEIGPLVKKLPAPMRGPVEHITATAFTAGLDRILLVAAIVVLASGTVAFATIRGKDFSQQTQGSTG
jgi:hypothetical protein